MSNLSDNITRQLSQMEAARGPWESHWQEVSEYCCPRRNAFYTTKYSGGEKRTTKLYDTTAIKALRVCASGLYGQLSSPNKEFFQLRDANVKLMDRDDVSEWYQDATKALNGAFQSSNFALAMHEMYYDLGAIGTACVYSEEHRQVPGSLWFSCRNMSEIFVACNELEQVDTVFRKVRGLSARGLVAMFGESKVSKRTTDLLKKDADTQVDVLHSVYPRDQYQMGGGAVGPSKGLPWASVWMELEGKHVLDESGYQEFPYVVPRWSLSSGEIYGRSPGMDALPVIKYANEIKRTLIRANQVSIQPPFQAPDDGYIMPLNFAPGGPNYYRAGSQDRIEPLQLGANPPLGYEALTIEQQDIREIFYNDLFLMLTETPRMTATEVIERINEKVVLIGPTLGRLDRECLSPLITRSFNILMRAGKISPPPPVLEGSEYEIVYVSPLAIAQRAADSNGLNRWVSTLAQLVQVLPDIMDNVDADRYARELGQIEGVPGTIIRDEADVAAKREERLAAMEAEQQKEDMERAAAGAVNAGKAIESFSGMGE